MRAIIIFARAMLFSSAETLEIAIYLYDLYLYDYAFPIWVKLRKTVEFVTTKPRDIHQLASECSQIMAGVYYVVTLAT